MLAELEASVGELLSPKDLSDIVLQDPMLCLLLLREAERRKSSRPGRETTTALAAILQLGVRQFSRLLLSSPEIDEGNAGLIKVEMRASLASHIARAWSTGRMDINPDEVAVAALLGGTGDLLLWAYAPEIPARAEAERDPRARRSAQAQQQACGFTFKELTLLCAERWHLPALLIQPLRGADTLRARLTRPARTPHAISSTIRKRPPRPWPVTSSKRRSWFRMPALNGWRRPCRCCPRRGGKRRLPRRWRLRADAE